MLGGTVGYSRPWRIGNVSPGAMVHACVAMFLANPKEHAHASVSVTHGTTENLQVIVIKLTRRVVLVLCVTASLLSLATSIYVLISSKTDHWMCQRMVSNSIISATLSRDIVEFHVRYAFVPASGAAREHYEYRKHIVAMHEHLERTRFGKAKNLGSARVEWHWAFSQACFVPPCWRDGQFFSWWWHYAENTRWPDMTLVTSRVTQILFPVWVLPPLFLLYPGIVFIRGPVRRWRRKRKGLCLKCGYDLTGLASPRCPECGTGVSIGSPHCGNQGGAS